MTERTEGPNYDYFVHFFIPLPEPIGLPARRIINFGSDEDMSKVLARTAPGDDLEPGVNNYCRLVVHKLEWTQPAHGIDDTSPR